MDLGLKDKVVIVTGGAKGIGRAITMDLVKEGAKVLIADRDAIAAGAFQKEIHEKGGTCAVAAEDLTAVSSCQHIVEQAVDELGGIDGLVNNAGVNDGAGLEQGPEKFESSIRINLLHYYNMVHYALPQLKENRGAIVNIASKTALTGQGGTSGYAASKGAQLALTREWAAELFPFGVRVNAVVPAEVMTPLYENWLQTFEHPEKKLEKIVSKIPLDKRMTEPQEIAAMAVFLLSARSKHTTGQWMIVDGGYVHLDRALT
ncbi:MAG: SDR family oxidoreductase [Bacteroidota bacterium]